MDNFPTKLVRTWATKIDWKGLELDPSVIAANSARIKARFEPADKPQDKPCALVGYGDSLKETWHELDKFDRIFTCSGAHKFLTERHIIPTYHVESDPQPHKPRMLGLPYHGVIYLMASICHPTYFDLLDSCDIKDVVLYHILFKEKHIQQYIPKNEWIITGGHTIGLRMMKIAYLLGYRDVHLLGFDGSGGYADKHEKPKKDKYSKMTFDGKTYLTNNNLFFHAMSLFRELNHSMQDLNVTFYGDGLIQAIGRKFKRTKGEKWPIAVMLG